MLPSSKVDRDLPSAPRSAVARVRPRVPGRAAPAARVVRPDHRGDDPRGAERAVAEAARRRRARCAVRVSSSPPTIGFAASGVARLADAYRRRPRPLPVPRARDDRDRVARRPSAGERPDDRAPRTSRVPRPAADPEGPRVPAEPPLPLGDEHARLPDPSRHHRRAARVGASGAARPARVRACRPIFSSSWRAGVERKVEESERVPAAQRAPPLRPRDAGRSGEGDPRRGGRGVARRQATRPRSGRGSNASAPSRWRTARLARRSRGRCSARATSRRSSTSRRCSDRPAGDVLLVARRRREPLALHGHDGGTGRLPALDARRRRAPRVARGLRERSRRSATVRPRRRCERGIRLEHVSFAYPGTDRLVLEDVDLELPAGSVVAIVGENGAGKTTLVKLLSPDVRADLRTDPRRRRRAVRHRPGRVARAHGRRVPGLLPLRVPRAPDGRPRRPRADGRAPGPARRDRARRRGRRDGEAPARLRHAARPASGTTASSSRSASGRSSRSRAASCATTRCCSSWTSRPPRSTRRPSTRCSSASPQPHVTTRDDGRITVLVSHRFSTVRMADLIVVLDGAHVVDSGIARRADGARRAVRGALRHPGERVPVASAVRVSPSRARDDCATRSIASSSAYTRSRSSTAS